MPLAIGVREGDKVFLNDDPLEVIKLQGYDLAIIKIKGKVFELSDKEAVEILPRVLVHCGLPIMQERNGEDPLPRLNFEAPPSVVILREVLYRRGKQTTT